MCIVFSKRHPSHTLTTCAHSILLAEFVTYRALSCATVLGYVPTEVEVHGGISGPTFEVCS
jgi:hypothetical protein